MLFVLVGLLEIFLVIPKNYPSNRTDNTSFEILRLGPCKGPLGRRKIQAFKLRVRPFLGQGRV